MAEPRVIVYSQPFCGYCSAAKSLLTRKKAAFTEYDIARDSTWRQQMFDRAAAGSRPMPSQQFGRSTTPTTPSTNRYWDQGEQS